MKYFNKFGFNKLELIFLLLTVFFIIFIIFSLDKVEKPKIESKNYVYIEGKFNSIFEKELSGKISKDDIYNIVRAYRTELNFKKLTPMDTYTLTLSTDNKFVSIDIDKGEYTYSVVKDSDTYVYTKVKNKLYESTVTVEGKIDDVLWNSMIAKDVPPVIILDFTDIFAWTVDFLTDVRKGDKFKLVYYIARNHHNRMVSRKIIAAMYDGSETGKKIMVEFNGEYYDENGEGAKSMFLKAPLHYRRISSYFSYNRLHPILKIVRPHLGIDYSAPTGTPVSAVADGVVVYKGWKGGFGNYVELKHKYGYYTSYGHLSKYERGLYVGKRVKQGDVIGYVGMTGLASGPHLDFRIRQGSKYLNYLRMKRTADIKLPKKYMPLLREKIVKYLGNVI